MELTLVFQRFSKNRLGKADEQRKEIGNAGNKHSSAPGVTSKALKLLGPVEELDDNNQPQLRYEFKVEVKKETFKSEDAAIKHLQSARKFVESAADARGWKCLGEESEVEATKLAADSRPEFQVPDLDDNVMRSFFGKIKEREAHIRLMHASVTAYRITNGKERNHTLLYGDPAAAKSSLIKGFKAWYESDNSVERILQVNATTLSKAGLEMMLLEKAEQQMLPEILWINELEKGTPDDFLCMLAVMDDVAQIQRLNTKVGRRNADCNILVWADCNDAEKIKNWNKGALWSRFNKRWACVRPSREVMTKILTEMVNERKQNGYPANTAWVKAAIDYAYDEMKTNDPREIKGLLDGGDGLLDGSYFRDIESIKMAEAISERAKRDGVFK